VEEILIYLPFLIPILAANYADRHRRQPYEVADPQLNNLLNRALPYLPHALLVTLNVALLGVSGLALLNELAARLMPEEMAQQGAVDANWLLLALAALLTALAGFLPLFPGVRRWVARWLDIDPESRVHMAALAYAIYQIGLSLGQMALIGSLENLAEGGVSLTVWDVLLSGLPLLIFALAGVGLWIRRNGRQTLERLGLRAVTWRQLLAAAGIVLLLLGLDFAVSQIWQEVNPFGYDVMERVMESLFGGLTTIVGALVLGLSAGISEELLFRGAVQPRLGLVVAALLFTVGHLQYGLTAATAEVFVIGLVLGLVRNRANTTLCIVIHATYNIVGILLEML
jgi:membrane protease YdiL (CAAX protease family)